MMFGRGFNGFGSCLGFGSGSGYGSGYGTGSGFIYGGLDMLMIGVLMLLAVAAIILVSRKAGHHRSENAAQEALRLRLVKGEITEEEYLKRKDILG